jgi:hypothetical protein
MEHQSTRSCRHIDLVFDGDEINPKFSEVLERKDEMFQASEQTIQFHDHDNVYLARARKLHDSL